MRESVKKLAWPCVMVYLFCTPGMAVPFSHDMGEPKSSELDRRYTSPTPVYPSNLSNTPIEVFTQILNTQADPDPDLIKSLVTFDATYVSLTFDNPVLHQVLPWAGTRPIIGPQAFIDTFTRVGLYWTRGPFTIDRIFGDGGNVTAWGNFEVTSNTLGKTISSPWSSRAEVNSDGKITYFQYMEDTFTTTSSFWDSGTKVYRASPYGGTVSL